MSRGLVLRLLIGVSCAGQLLPAQAQSLLLAVFINGQDKQMVQGFEEQHGKLSMAREDLLALGIKAPRQGGAVQVLDRLPGCHYRIDWNAQVVYLQLPEGALIARQLRPSPPARVAPALQGQLGAVLNYDSQFTHGDGQTSSSNLATLRVSSAAGVLESGVLQSHTASLDQTVRLQTTWSQSDTADLRRLNTGDFVTGSLSWTRSVRLLGLQSSTAFGLRPDLITYPQPGISAAVAVPSSVDVYVNGMRQLSGQVAPGPFEVDSLPVTSGAGDISLLIKDASGRQTRQTLPFYTSNLLLREGLDAVSMEAGSVRRHYATQSNDYGPGAFSASYRRGLSDRFTLESHLEGSDSLAMAGLGGDWLVGQWGVLNGSLAQSRAEAGAGRQYGVGFARATPWFNAGVSLLKADAGFNDIASVNGDQRPGTTLRANLGGTLPGVGSLGMVFVKKRVNLYDVDTVASSSVQTSSLSLTFSRPLPGGAYGSVTAFHDFAGGTGNGLFVGLSMLLGARTQLSVDSSHSGGSSYQTVQAEQATVSRGDIGWQLSQQRGDINVDDLGVSYKSAYGLLSAQAEQSAGSTAMRIGARGAVSTLDGHVFASNTIDDSFAVADTDGIAGVQVYQENRPVGRTNSQGLLFIEGLRAYQNNQLSIDPGDVPLDVDLGSDRLQVYPRDRSGVLARFAIQRSRSATVKLLDRDGKALALGAKVTVDATGETTRVGYEGEFFVQRLSASNAVTVQARGKPLCHARFTYVATAGSIPLIGPLTCE